MAADLLDILTFEEASAAVHLEPSRGVNQASKLEMFNSGIARKVDKLCGPVVRRTVVDTLDGGEASIWLSQYPVVSITTVTEAVNYGTASTIAAAGYHPELAYGRLHRRNNRWASGVGNVVVTYVAGRYTTTATVDPEWKLPVQNILAFIWREAAATWQRSPEPDEQGIPSSIDIEALIRGQGLPVRGPGVVMT